MCKQSSRTQLGRCGSTWPSTHLVKTLSEVSHMWQRRVALVCYKHSNHTRKISVGDRWRGMAITYFAKEGLQGLVVACSCSASFARHVGFYPGALQGAAGAYQAQVCQPFLYVTTDAVGAKRSKLDRMQAVVSRLSVVQKPSCWSLPPPWL